MITACAIALTQIFAPGASFGELAAKSYAIGRGNTFRDGQILFADDEAGAPKAYTDEIRLGDIVLKKAPFVGNRCLRTDAGGNIVEHTADCGGLTISGIRDDMIKIGGTVGAPNQTTITDANFLSGEVTVKETTGANLWSTKSIPVINADNNTITSSRIKFHTNLVGDPSSPTFPWLFEPSKIAAGCLEIDANGVINTTGASCGGGSPPGNLLFSDIHASSPTNTGALISAQQTDLARGKYTNPTSSSSNAFSTTVTGLTLLNGARFVMKMGGIQSGAGTVTLNVNSLGAKNISVNGSTTLTAGMLKANGVYMFVYDTTGSGVWHAMGVGIETSGGLSISGVGGNIVKVGTTSPCSEGTAGCTKIEDSGIMVTNAIRKKGTESLMTGRFLLTDGTAGETAGTAAHTYGTSHLDAIFNNSSDCSSFTTSSSPGGNYWYSVLSSTSPTSSMSITCRRFGDMVTVSFIVQQLKVPENFTLLENGDWGAASGPVAVFARTTLKPFKQRCGFYTYNPHLLNSTFGNIMSVWIRNEGSNGQIIMNLNSHPITSPINFVIQCTFMVEN